MVFLISFFVLGTIIGGQINHAIYRFAFFSYRPISPWMKLTESAEAEVAPRWWLDFIPLVGWTTLVREEKIHGSYFWIRPFLIELFSGCALVGLYLFHIEYSSLTPGPIEIFPQQALTQWTWFGLQAAMITLLAIATFIDFDEFMIPDQVTVTGVVLFVVAAAIFPPGLLPNITSAGTVEVLIFSSPDPYPIWTLGMPGCLAGIACLWFWALGLIPKTLTLRKGWGAAFPLMIASIRRPPRKQTGTIPIRPRTMYGGTPVLLGLALAGTPAIVLTWVFAGPENQIGLLTALFGMLFGMCMIWSIRIVGRLALGKEAMGFGDVTLMAMIGSYVGWQACLPILGVSAFVALLVSVPMALLKRDNALPYGPYLSIATVVVILFWNQVWENWLKGVFNLFGAETIFMVLVAMTIPMFLLLLGTRFVKERLLGLG